jgi:hypothetical protein
MDSHPEGAHQPRRRAADVAKAEDAAAAAAQHLAGAVLVELAAPHLLVLDEQPLRSGKRHRDDVLGHRLSPAAPVGGDGQLRRQPARRHPINAGGCELQQPRVADQWDLVRTKLL